MSKHSRINLWGTHTSTVLSITLVLLLLGLLMMLEYHTYRQAHNIQEQITFRVDLRPDLDESESHAIESTIAKMPYVKHVEYISRDEAAKIFSADLGDDFVAFLGYNPLFPSLWVNLRADLLPDNSTRVLEQFKKDVQVLDGVSEVMYQETVVEEMNDIYYKMSWFLIIFIGLLLLLSIILINSTIRIALFAQRETIKTMRMVGAKTRFIVRPFVGRSILYGMLGGLIASVLMVAFMWLFNDRLHLGLDITTDYLWYCGIAIILVVIGVAICWLSTIFAVRHYIRTDENC